jgi:hypothetical protein
VTEYGEIFNKLARYAPDDVSTDAKRQSEFIRGLNDEISIQLVAVSSIAIRSYLTGLWLWRISIGAWKIVRESLVMERII